MNDQEVDQLLALAEDLVARAKKAGADVAESSSRAGWELSTRVRLGEPELVEEAGHRSVSLRVMKDQRVAITSTSDLSASGIERCVSDAMMLVDLSEADSFAGPADPSELCAPPHPDLDLYDPEIEKIDADEAVRRATLAERAALESDPRITLSEGATFSRTTGASARVISTGFRGAYRGSYASLVVTPVVEDEGGKRRRGYYWTARRHVAELEDGVEVGREAARRTLQKLGARKVPTATAPVVFDPDVARGLIGTLAGCILGGSIWRKSSYLVGREGSTVASALVTIVDDPLMARGPGSRPYDAEGLRSRKNAVVTEGVLQTYLLDCYSARKLGKKSTASASGSGSIGASTSNFILLPQKTTRDEIIASTKRGLYVTEMMGFGFNAVTGDYSRGASGFWIEDGKLTHAVSEITVSSNLDAMLKGIDAVGDDLDTKTSTASPTIRIAEMTIAGT